MSYTPTVWHDGDTITAEAMNKIEQGIADGGNTAVVIIDCTETTASRSMGYYVGLCKEETHDSITRLAIKARITEGFFATYERGLTVLPVLPLADVITDDYDVCVLFESGDIYGFGVSTVGDIFESELLAAVYEDGVWNSGTYGAYVVQGSGKIVLMNS